MELRCTDYAGIFYFLVSHFKPLQKYGVDNLGMVGGLVRYQKNVTSVFSVCRWYCHADS